MRHLAIAFFMMGVGCSKQPLGGDPPPEQPTRVIHCKSADAKYGVDLSMYGKEKHPRLAQVDPGPDAGPETQGVSGPHGFPSPTRLTCSGSGEPSSVGCYVAGTADYGYIVRERIDGSGKRTIELLKNGIASEFLANLDCDG